MNEPTPNICGTIAEYNAAIDEMKDEIEWEPLLDFLDRLKEPVDLKSYPEHETQDQQT